MQENDSRKHFTETYIYSLSEVFGTVIFLHLEVDY